MIFLQYLTTLLLHFGVKSEHLTTLWQHFLWKPAWFPHFCFVKLRFPTPRRRGPLWSETFISEASYLSLLQYLPTLWLHFDSRRDLFCNTLHHFPYISMSKVTTLQHFGNISFGSRLLSLLLLCESKISYPTQTGVSFSLDLKGRQ